MIRLSTGTKWFLVVDAWVIATASTRSFDDRVWKAIDILSKILHVCHKIVLDLTDPASDAIIDEYQRQATSEFAKRWIIAMQTRQDKIVYRSRAPVIFSALTDPDDLKYLQVAINSPHKTIISEDSDLTNIANDSQITSNGITIWKLDDALNRL